MEKEGTGRNAVLNIESVLLENKQGLDGSLINEKLLLRNIVEALITLFH